MVGQPRGGLSIDQTEEPDQTDVNFRGARSVGPLGLDMQTITNHHAVWRSASKAARAEHQPETRTVVFVDELKILSAQMGYA